MSDGSRCGECGGAVGGEPSLMGLCPRCLLGGVSGGRRRPPAVPASVRAALPGVTFGGVIGRGGTGVVYAGRQADPPRAVAVKVMPADADPVRAARFAAEGRTLAGLDHPHIVAAYGSGRTADCFYLVMERVDGPTLRAAMAGGPLPVAEAVRVAGELCDALAYAHGRGVLHRDVKPENVLLEAATGAARLVDFGLATAVGRTADDPSLTGPRDVLGTRDYVAPECRRGAAEGDARADLFAVGVVLYEMLVGRPPVGHFARPGQVDSAARRLDPVVLRCLADDPAKRYATAADLRSALDRSGRPRRWPAAAAVAGVGATTAVVVGTLLRRPVPVAGPSSRSTAERPAAVVVATEPVVKQLDLESIGLGGGPSRPDVPRFGW